MAYSTYFPYQAPQGYFQPQTANYQPQMMQAQQAVQTAQQSGYNCRPVTSREEALAVQVEFFGPGTLMPDIAHGVVYLKRFDQNTGNCDLITFTAEMPKRAESVRYATIEDLEKLRLELTRKEIVNDDE